MTDLAPGMLLVAAPSLADPNFAGSVVLLVDVAEEGASGIVLNKPTRMPADTVLGEWSEHASTPELIFTGGPVAQEGVVALALLDPAVYGADEQVWSQVVDRLGLLHLDAPYVEARDIVIKVRLFLGYAGWGAGQLDAEVRGGDWHVVPAVADDAFAADPEALWRRVLRRQRDALAWLSTYVEDPQFN